MVMETLAILVPITVTGGNTCNQHSNHAPSSRCKKFSDAVAAGWLTCVNKAQCVDSICSDAQIVVAGEYCSTDTCDAGDADTCCTLSCEALEQEWLDADCACTDGADCTAKKTAWSDAGCERKPVAKVSKDVGQNIAVFKRRIVENNP